MATGSDDKPRDHRYDTAKRGYPTRKGFSAAGLSRSAIFVAVLSVMMLLILAFLDQTGVGILMMLPVLACAVVLYMLSIRRRLRDSLVDAMTDTLAAHFGAPDIAYLQIDARQWRGGWVGVPHLLNVRYPAVVDATEQGWAEDVAHQLDEELGKRYVVARHNFRGRQLTLRDPEDTPGRIREDAAPTAKPTEELASRLPEKVDRPIPSDDDLSDRLIPLGVDASGTRVAWSPSNHQGSLLALGRSGAGKRVLVTGIVMEAAARGWPVWIIDHRRVDLLGMRDWPNVQIVASTLDDQIAVLNQAWREMESRVALIESGTSTSELEPLVVVVHHFREFATAVADAAKRAEQGSTDSSLVPDRVTDLLRHGRQVNVFVVLSVQRADDPLLRSEHRDEIGVVVAMGRLDTSATSELWRGEEGSGDTTDPVSGRATVRAGENAPVAIQCYWTPDPREARRSGEEQDLYLVEAVKPRVVTHAALHVHRPPARTDRPAAAWQANLSAELREGYSSRSSALVDWSRTSTPAVTSSTTTGSGGKDVEGWSEVVMVSQLEPGNLARLDDDTGWVVVEQVDGVENDGTRLRIDWRGTDGAGSVVVSRTQTVRIRHMNDGVY